MGKYICIGKNRISFDTPKQGGIISDDRWITINADEEEGRKGQHVLIKENGTIVWGLGGKFKHLSELGKKNVQGATFARDYNCELAKKLGKEHYDEIRDLVEKCPDENLKKLWQQHENQIEVLNAHAKGGAFCRGKSISLNIEEVSQGTILNKPYEVAFHECGHAIDRITKNKRLCIEYKDGIFGQTIAKEITEHIEKMHVDMKQAFKSHANNVEWLYEHDLLPRKVYDEANLGLIKLPLKYKKEMAYQMFDDILKWYQPSERSDIRDMVSGVTKNKAGAGHSTKYWNDHDKAYGKNGGVAIEAFAEMTSATISNPDSLKVIKRYLPMSYTIYREMIEEAANE